MKFINSTDKRTGEKVQLNYVDYGQGQPVVLIHGWPSSKEMWEDQFSPIVEAGFRCIKYDRRGFGKSDKPWDGYDYDSLAADLKAVLDGLDLQNVILVGFSMGGGEVALYFGKYGGARVSKVVLVSTVLPFMLKTEDNPEGVDGSVFDEMLQQMTADRMAFLDGFGKRFFGINLVNHPVSTPYLNHFAWLASIGSPRATKETAKAFAQTDFRKDIPAINVPTLIIHGDADNIVPIEASSNRTAKMLPNATYKVYEGAPHGLFMTEKEKLNKDLITFFKS